MIRHLAAASTLTALTATFCAFNSATAHSVGASAHTIFLQESSSNMNGRADYYLAVATVIPLLLIAYFFNVDIPGTIARITGKQPNRAHAWFYRITLELFAPVAAIVGSILGETACLMALYSGEPTASNSDQSVAGLILLAFAGFIHLIILSVYRLKRIFTR
jgi:hypothetical protein